MAAATSAALAAAAADSGFGGEYVFEESGAETWPWSTSKGRAVLFYQEGVAGENEELAIPNAGNAGLATDGTTLWHANNNWAYAWTIEGVRDSDKDIDLSANGAASNDFYGITVLNNELVGVNNGLTSRSIRGVYSYNFTTKIGRLVIPFGNDDNFSGVTTDGITVWVVNSTQGKANAYSAADWSAVPSKDITIGINTPTDNQDWADAATDGSTIWFYSRNLEAAIAWNLSDRTRDISKDFWIKRWDEGSNRRVGTTVLNRSELFIAAHDSESNSTVIEKFKLTGDRELVVGSKSYGLDPRGFIDYAILDQDSGLGFGGVTTNGTTVWVEGKSSVMAWTIAGVRDSSKDIAVVGFEYYHGLAIHGNTLFLPYNAGHGAPQHVRTYNLTTGALISSTFIHASFTGAITTDGTTIWLGKVSGVAEAYLLADGSRQPSKDINIGVHARSIGEGDLATDGKTLWFFNSATTIHAWDIASRSRAGHRDIRVPGKLAVTSHSFIDINDSTLYIKTVAGPNGPGTGSSQLNVATYKLSTDEKFGPGHYEVTGASKGDPIRATLKEDEDFAIVYPVY